MNERRDESSLDHILALLAAAAWHGNGMPGDPPPERIPAALDIAHVVYKVGSVHGVDKLIPGTEGFPASQEEALSLMKEVHAIWDNGGPRGAKWPHPLKQLVLAYVVDRPVPSDADVRPNPILPASLGMVGEAHKRAPTLIKWFSPAAHQRGQLVLPGFHDDDNSGGPALPIQLYHLGNRNPNKPSGRGAPLSMRLFLEAIMAVPQEKRAWGPVSLPIHMQDLRSVLYPNNPPKPYLFYEMLMRARDELNARDALIPWFDPVTQTGGTAAIVTMIDMPRGPDFMDDVVRFIVNLPPGSGPGPVIPESLRQWGVRSLPAYSALINLSYLWFVPGRTRIPAQGGQHWLQVNDPSRYPELTDDQVVRLSRPLSTKKERSHLVAAGFRTLHQLDAAGDIRLDGRRVMPPLRSAD